MTTQPDWTGPWRLNRDRGLWERVYKVKGSYMTCTIRVRLDGKRGPIISLGPTPVERARAMGHDVIDDSPGAPSKVQRWTCRDCGAAALRYGTNVYGSALTNRCTNPETTVPE